METRLVKLRMLLSVIVLIAASVVAGLAGHASRAGVTADVATLSTSAPHKVVGHVVSTNQEHHRATCDDCLDCMHVSGFGCCAAGIFAIECGVLNDAPVAVRFMVGRLFLAMGIDPEALLHPPQTLG
jgi:hypothetical protein